MIHCRAYVARTDTVHVVDESELKGLLRDPENLVWIDLESPTSNEADLLGHELGLSPLTIEDVLSQGQRAKLESYDHYLHLVMHGLKFNPRDGVAEAPEVDFVVGENYLVSVRFEPMEYINRPRETALEESAAIMKRGSDFLLYNLVDGLVDSYFPVLDQVDDSIDELEDRIVAAPDRSVMARIFALKRAVLLMRKVISPQMEAFQRLTGRVYPQVKAEHVFYFRDIHDHLIRIFEMVDSYRDLMSGALDAYLSTVSNRLSDIMKRLTVIATIFMPITFITGVFGMNFGVAPQVVWDNGSLFWLALLGMGTISAAQIAYFRRQGWI